MLPSPMTRRHAAALAALLSLLGGPASTAAADAAPAGGHETARVYAIGTLIGAQIRVRGMARQGAVSAAFAACVGRLGPENFDAVWESAIRKALTADELRATDRYWGSPAGQRKRQAMRVETYRSHGEQPPGMAATASAPPLSDDDNAAFAAFMASAPAARLNAAFEKNPAVGEAIKARVKVLFDACKAQAGQP